MITIHQARKNARGNIVYNGEVWEIEVYDDKDPIHREMELSQIDQVVAQLNLAYKMLDVWEQFERGSIILYEMGTHICDLAKDFQTKEKAETWAGDTKPTLPPEDEPINCCHEWTNWKRNKDVVGPIEIFRFCTRCGQIETKEAG